MANAETSAPDLTLLQRLLRAGIGEEKAQGLIRDGHIRVNGDVANDPGHVTPFGSSRWVVAGQ